MLRAASAGLAVAAALTVVPLTAWADWKPTRAIEYIAPANPGGGWDTLIRTTARVIQEEGLAEQNFAPINIPGGGGSVAWAQIAADRGNPHKLFAVSPPIILVPLAGQSAFDHTAFTPIARLITDYSIILVRADSPHETINDLMEAIRANPALAVGGGSAPGSMDHIASAGAARAAGLDAATLNYIPFSGGGEAMVALLGGHVQAVATGAGEASAQLAGGEIRALAVSAPERMEALPDVPTFQEQGIDFTFDIWRGIMGTPDMPAEAVAYYADLFASMAETEGWLAARAQLGWLDAFQGPDEFGAFLDGQKEQFSTILTDLGLM
ncbi:MAG: tripartite tricarboxylate transporter substrate binding protein [Geminicoccaceae bacterium]|nr:MAG: tripartite tricarboxylate transporter substrate binding protein [Geminicoccaceae bacterium]